MARKDPASHVDRDGVRTSKRRSKSDATWIVVSIAIVAVATVVVTRWLSSETSPSGSSSTVSSAPAGAPEPNDEWASVKEVKATRAPDREPRAEADPDEPLPEIDARDVINALVEAGETGGIAAFPPPGTDPPKRGIVVPQDYELPEGYVRHYQSTDDGKDLEPILMFSPDYEFRDQNGQPIALPKDRVVPPELAPAGLPIRTLDVPESGR